MPPAASRHILFISSWYPNRNDLTHGIFNRHFAEAASRYHKISVLHVCSDEGIAANEVVESNENGIYTVIVYYPKVRSKMPVLSQMEKRSHMIKATEEAYGQIVQKIGRPDLIQLNVIMPNGIAALHLSKKYQLPMVINEGWTGYLPEDGSYQGRLQKYFTRKIAGAASRLMPVSNSLKQAMLEQGITGDYTIVPNVVNTDLFKPSEKTNSRKTRFIHVSTLEQRQKNVLGMIGAFKNALKENSDLELTLVGDGEDRKMLEEFVRNESLSSQVTFKGVLLKQDMVNELNAHDALVMFSNYESFCVVIAEAMACGKPVLSSLCGGLTSLLKKDHGYVFEPGDQKALTSALLEFSNTKNNFDPALIRKFITDHFTSERVGAMLNEVYLSVLKR